MFLISTFLLALALGIGFFALYQILVRDRDPVTARLRDLRTRALAARPKLDAETPSPVAQLLAALGGFLPTGEDKEALQSGLVRAGIRSQGAAMIFLGAKAVFAVVFAVGWIVLNFALARPIGSIFFSGMVAGVVGFYTPTMWLAMKGGARRGRIQQALPDALDLMVVCVEAGLGLTAAIERVGREIAIASPALSSGRGSPGPTRSGVSRVARGSRISTRSPRCSSRRTSSEPASPSRSAPTRSPCARSAASARSSKRAKPGSSSPSRSSS
jgi:hypothetical protein